MHISLSDIDSVKIEKTGDVKVVLLHHRNAKIPLDKEEAQKLVSKLNQLIPEAKQRELERKIEEHRVRETVEEENDLRRVRWISGVSRGIA